jgi:hypothetical protein
VAYSGWHCTRLISPAGSSLLLHHNNHILRILRHLVLLLLPPHLVLLDINLPLQREERTYLEKSICLHVRLVRLLGARKQGIMVIGELPSFRIYDQTADRIRFIPTRENSAHAAFQLLPESGEQYGGTTPGRKVNHGQGTDVDVRRGRCIPLVRRETTDILQKKSIRYSPPY